MGETKVFRDHSICNEHGTVQNITINGNVDIGALQAILGFSQDAPHATSDPVLEELDKLVRDAIANNKSPKYILLPIRAAKEAEVLPMADLAWVNSRYDLKLNSQNWSDWINKKDTNYDSRELYPLISRFQKLKSPNN